MLYQIFHKLIPKKILFELECKYFKTCIETGLKQRANLQWADLQGANLQGANLQGANLQGADLQWADLQGANLQGADLQRADLQGANLQGANLQGANLQWTDLQGADLQWADLQRADLQGANLDFSCFPLWCRSTNIKIDKKLAKQILAHAFNIGKEFWPNKLTNEQKEFLNDFHRIKSNEFPRFE